MRRFYAYIRVSTESQRENSSPEDQRRRCQATADFQGFDEVEFVEDLAVSGAIPFAQRPGGGKLWAQLKEGDMLCVSKLDRMFRSAEDALVTSRQLRERGIGLIVTDLTMDPITNNGMGKIMLGLMATFAEFERERIAERTEAGRAAKKASGGYGGGRRPFGYEVEGKGREARLVPNPKQQKAIADIKAWSESGESTRTIAAKVKEAHGFYVSHVTVAKILKENA